MIQKLLIVIGVLTVIAAIGHFGESWLRRHGMETIGDASKLIGGLGLVIVAPGGAMLILFRLLTDFILFRKPQIVVVYGDGIANLDHNQLQTWHWSDIAAIYVDSVEFVQGMSSWQQARCDIFHQDGRFFSISTFIEDFDCLLATVCKEVHGRIQPQVFQRAAAGEAIPFGQNILVEAQGLRIAKQFYPWKSISDFRLTGGFLDVLGPTPGCPRVPVRSIANPSICIELLRQKICSQKRSAAPKRSQWGTAVHAT